MITVRLSIPLVKHRGGEALADASRRRLFAGVIE
jgi:hypothetical protein